MDFVNLPKTGLGLPIKVADKDKMSNQGGNLLKKKKEKKTEVVLWLSKPKSLYLEWVEPKLWLSNVHSKFG